jgi:hypothetical protein
MKNQATLQSIFGNIDRQKNPDFAFRHKRLLMKYQIRIPAKEGIDARFLQQRDSTTTKLAPGLQGKDNLI